MAEREYHEPELGITGTANELAMLAEHYTDSYTDAALEKIVSILRLENKLDKAQRVEFALEARWEVQNHKFALGRVKLMALNGVFELINATEGNRRIHVDCETESVFIRVNALNKKGFPTGVGRCIPMSLRKFLELSSDDFELLLDDSLSKSRSRYLLSR